MKKIFIYSMAAVASLALASCNGDYDDWASPQANSQADAVAKYGVSFTAGSEANSVLPDADGQIHLVTVSSSNEGVSGFTLKTLTINGETVEGSMVGNDIVVSADDLQSLVCNQNSSRAAVARDIDVNATVSVNLTSGDAVTTDVTGEVAGTVTPPATPAIDPNGYYLLGNLNDNGWDVTRPIWMTQISDGVYQATVTTTGDSNWYKFYAGSGTGDWDSANAGQMGCLENGDNSTSGFVIYTGDPWGEVQTPVISGAGTWLVTLDMNNLRYTVTSPVLYVAGDANGWNQVEPLGSSDGNSFTGFAYLNGNGFKFCSQKDWNGTNYGQDFNTAGDAANWSLPSGYGASYYKIDLNISAKTMSLTPISTIGVIGDATPGGWGDDTDMTYNSSERCWEINGITLTQGEIKFRANDGWDINWGGTEDNLTQGGANIGVSAGTYNIKLYAWANGYAYCTITKQ